MAADIFAVSYFALWTGLLLRLFYRVDADLLRARELRAVVLLLQARRNG